MRPPLPQEPRTVSTEFIADPELAREIEKRSKPCAPIRDGVLFRQGQLPTALYLVKSGEVALAMESENRLVMCVRAGPGSLIGLPAIVGNKSYSMTAAPCARADIRQISSADFNDLISNRPLLAMKVLQVLAAEVHLARRCCLELIS
jgi:CRP-like cAMP-binding protein